MRQSQLFSKTRREDPVREESVNARLLIRAGFVHKEMAGVYSFLPLGLRVLNNIVRVIREEMNGIGGQEVFLASLQDPGPWKRSGRWSDKVIDVWFKTVMAGGEVGIANTHEEPLVRLLTHHVSSYKDLPFSAYQFQTKFRNELRAKSGILRMREFLMKDLYSFSRSEQEFRGFYEECAAAYGRVFSRLGIGDRTFRTYASGGAFSLFSDEFQTICEAGEDTIYLDPNKKLAVNKEVYTDEVLKKLGLKKSGLQELRAIEVGNIFPLGTKYSEALGLSYRDEQGKEHPVVMGSYGIGPGRLMGTLVEVLHDEKGIVWPREAAPFSMHLLALPGARQEAEKLYAKLCKQGMEVLYDDRENSPGEKLQDADLLGIPQRVVVSEKTLAKKSAEVKQRTEERAELIPLDAVGA